MRRFYVALCAFAFDGIRSGDLAEIDVNGFGFPYPKGIWRNDGQVGGEFSGGHHSLYCSGKFKSFRYFIVNVFVKWSL